MGLCQPQSTSHALVLAVDRMFSHNNCHSHRIQFLGMSSLFLLRTHALLWVKARESSKELPRFTTPKSAAGLEGVRGGSRDGEEPTLSSLPRVFE